MTQKRDQPVSWLIIFPNHCIDRAENRQNPSEIPSSHGVRAYNTGRGYIPYWSNTRDTHGLILEQTFRFDTWKCDRTLTCLPSGSFRLRKKKTKKRGSFNWILLRTKTDKFERNLFWFNARKCKTVTAICHCKRCFRLLKSQGVLWLGCFSKLQHFRPLSGHHM